MGMEIWFIFAMIHSDPVTTRNTTWQGGILVLVRGLLCGSPLTCR